MKNLLLITLLISGLNVADAETTLPFPTTAADIVQALSPTSGRAKKGFNNSDKGVNAIKDDQPKVGALILFDFDSAIIKPESYPLLQEFASALQGGLANAELIIAGHTDNIGSEAYNFTLSKRRANSVKNFFVSIYNIADNRLTIQYHGESQPIESNDTETGRLHNRRVEFIRAN